MNNPELSRNTSDKSFLPNNYEPSELDVICGRCRTRPNHSANKAFRRVIIDSLQLYTAAITRRAKSIVVSDIANKLLFNGDKSLRFIQFCGEGLRWFELPYETIRLKVGQALLDTMIQLDPERSLKQKNSQRRCRLRRKGITSDIARRTINPSAENVDKTSPLATTAAQRVENSHSLQPVAPSEHHRRLNSSREDVTVTSGVSSFVEARISTCEVSTSDSGRNKEDSAGNALRRVAVGLQIQKEGSISKCGCKAGEK
jgi:hypothetical protein